MSEQPVTNGPSDGGKFIDTIDPDDPEYIKQMRRPAEVKEDVSQMETRKRVQLVLNSQAFRDELEQIVNDQTLVGASPSSIAALHQLSELLLPQRSHNQFSKATGSVIPISDIRGVDSLNYGKGEKMMRCKLASLYRLADLMGWAQNNQGLITCRLHQDLEHFLTAPHGLLFHEVTASSLVKLDMQGNVLDPGSTASLAVNRNAYLLHSAIHANRPDIKCIIHLRNPQASTLSSLKSGLMPLSQEAISIGEPSYYTYNCQPVNADEMDRLARAIGPINKVLILRNYGVMVGGGSIDEAFMLAKNLVAAVESQVQLLPLGDDNILLPSDQVRQQMYELSMQVPQPLEEGRRKWRRGELQFEAYMRHLDNAGFRTGHIYHEPLLKKDRRMERANSEIEIPPTSSSFGAYEDGKFQSPLKNALERQKKLHKTDWLNTPNAYKKEEINETGTPNPKKITKWVEDKTSHTGTTPVKIENRNQFAPQGENPKELKEKYKSIKKEYYEEKIDAGPQSKILEGTTWEEAQRLNESGGDKVIMVGAASKGIIQKDHQHNAHMYKTYYAQNPFDNVSEEEVAKYQQEVLKQGGGGETPLQHDDSLEPGPDGKLISTQERMMNIKHGGQGDAPSAVKLDIPDQDDANFQRSKSARYPDKSPELIDELEKSPTFEREKAKSERKPKKKKSSDVNGEQLASPTKSVSSGDGTLDERSSREGSPSKEMSAPEHGSPEKGEKKKKKFRMPSFSKQKKEKKAAKQSAV